MNWINLSKTSRKALILIMLRAYRPIRIAAASVIPMDIKSFLQVSIEISWKIRTLFFNFKYFSDHKIIIYCFECTETSLNKLLYTYVMNSIT